MYRAFFESFRGVYRGLNGLPAVSLCTASINVSRSELLLEGFVGLRLPADGDR